MRVEFPPDATPRIDRGERRLKAIQEDFPSRE
jgi:hypothetical protein